MLNTCRSNCIPVTADVSPGNGSAAMPRALVRRERRSGNSCIFCDKILTYLFNESHVEQSCDAFIIWAKALRQLKQVLKLYLCAVSQFSTPDKSTAFSTYSMQGKSQKVLLGNMGPSHVLLLAAINEVAS